jgi:Kelch motif
VKDKKFAGILSLCSALAVAVSFLLLAPTAKVQAAAGINSQISFEGKIVKADGTNINSGTGTYNMEFKIYQDGNNLGSGSTLKWTEDWLVGGSGGVSITDGTFQVNLGAHNAFASQVDWNQDTLWLSLQIGNTSSCTISTDFHTDCGGDGEMTPYIRLTAVPYAQNANALQGINASGFIQNTTSLQASSNFNISGTGVAGTAFQAPTFDVASAGTLSIGTGSNATAINIGNTSSNKTTTVSGLFISKPTSGHDSTTAFQIQNASGQSLFTADTSGFNLALLGGNNTGELQTWNSTTAINVSGAQIRSELTSVVANGYVYAIGGLNGTSPQDSVYYAKLNADGTVGAWAATTSINVGGSKPRADHTSVVANGYLYVIGGYDGSNILDTVYYAKLNADGTIGSWNSTTSINVSGSQPRAFHTSVVANGYLYVIGGENSTTVKDTVYYAKLNSDGTIGSWNSTSAINVASVSQPRWHHSSLVANGYLYVIGGKDSSSSKDTVYYAKLNSDGTLGSWSATTNMNSDPRWDANTVMANGYFYVIGGKASSSVMDTVFSAKVNSDGTVGTWNYLNSTINVSGSQPRSSAGAVVFNGYIYLVAGFSGSANQSTVYYTSVSRTSLNGSLDLVGPQGANAADAGTSSGSLGGSIFAGNITSVGSLQVQGQGTFSKDLSVAGSLYIQPAASFIAGQTSIYQNLTNASSTGGTVQGYSQTITVSNTSSASTTNGINIAITDATTLTNASSGVTSTVTDNGASGAKTNKAVTGTAGGTNTSAVNYGGYFALSGGASTSAALFATNGTASGNILQLQDGTTPTTVFTVADAGLITLQPAANLTSGQTDITQTLTNASSTGGTVDGYKDTITISPTSSASTTNAIELALTDATTLANTNIGVSSTVTDNGASGGKTNSAVKAVGAGTNSSQLQYVVDSSANHGVAIRGASTGAGGSITCGPTTAADSIGVCGTTTLASSAGFGGYFAATGNGGTALFATNGTSSANILQLQDGTTPTTVFTVADSGATTITGMNATAGNAVTVLTVTGGNGASTTTAGNGSSISLTAGNGGSGATANGNGGSLTLAAGSAGAGAGTAGTVGTVTVKNAANSTTAFQVQNASSVSIFAVDTVSSHINIFDPSNSANYVDIYYDDASSSAILAASAGVVQVGGNSGPVTISTSAGDAVNITANGNSTWQTASGSSLTIQGGSGLNLYSLTSSAVTVDSTTTGAVNIGNNANAKTITVGNTQTATGINIEAGTGSTAIQIGNGATAHGIQIGSGGAIQTIIIGSTNSSSALTLQGGSGNVTLMTSTGNKIQIGSSTTDANSTILVLDSYNQSSDPTGTNGGMYYNTNKNKFRCFENSAWTNCITTAPNAGSFLDTTPGTLSNNTTTEIFNDATRPNITPSSTSAPVLVTVTVKAHGASTSDSSSQLRIVSNVGSAASCSTSSTVGTTFNVSFTTSNATTDMAAGSFTYVDTPATTSQVFYTVCSNAMTGTQTADSVVVTLAEIK